MSLIAEFTIETPILEHALEGVPEMVLETESIRMRSEGRTKGIIWAQGGDFDTFQARLEKDPTVATFQRLTEVDDRRLYSIEHTERAEDAMTYPALVDHDVVLLNTTGTHEGMEVRARFPDRDALTAYRNACREREVPFHLASLFQEDRVTDDGGRHNPYGLTNPQREALQAALEMGYFAVPRKTTLEDVANELDVSVQALSTRFRRGQRTLLRNLLDQ